MTLLINPSNMKRNLLICIAFCLSTGILYAKENTGVHRLAQAGHRVAAGCLPSTSSKDLDINNVRCPIWINGDMWWDLVNNARFEIPKDSKKYSLFAGALW